MFKRAQEEHHLAAPENSRGKTQGTRALWAEDSSIENPQKIEIEQLEALNLKEDATTLNNQLLAEILTV